MFYFPYMLPRTGPTYPYHLSQFYQFFIYPTGCGVITGSASNHQRSFLIEIGLRHGVTGLLRGREDNICRVWS